MSAAHRDPSTDAHRRTGLPSGVRRAALAAAALAAATAAGVLAARVVATPPLLRVETPPVDAVVGVGGLELLVRFEAPERVEVESFRAVLNGADVTGRLEVAANGAHGVLHGLLDGPNRLVLSVRGYPWGSHGPRVESQRRREVRFRRPAAWDRG